MAFLDNEPGSEVVRSLIFHSNVSTVSLAEAYSILAKRGEDGIAVFKEVRFAMGEVVPFTERQAEIAGALRASTQQAGLSLGDRACLALAIDLNGDVYTTDRVWATLNLPCKVHLIR
jgi:PIN domain nuclease of toxin-antitoxin system